MIDTTKLRRLEDCKGKLTKMVGHDAILHLSKEGLCPHYILTNPIDQTETVLFQSSEVEDWLKNNYVEYTRGHFTQKHEFIVFDKYKHEVKSSSQIPPGLNKIQELYELPMDYVKTPPGVYFLCKNSKVQYIGQARNIMTRITAHVSSGKKDFDKVFFITCPLSGLNKLESALIKYYQPPLNTACKIAPKQEHIEIVENLMHT